MILDYNRFIKDESMSNPMAVAMKYYDCPIKQICFYIVVGSGNITDSCEFFRIAKEEQEFQCSNKDWKE